MLRRSRRIFSASFSPMRIRALYTETPSMIESDAPVDVFEDHGVSFGLIAH